ncbi:ribosome biogenesis GTPase Der [Campylobacter jejuni]|uniref:GTPase Der n=1 Tax=Campylobacter jejuni subsp. jejuni serotype O:23/36 (strain 81-176) TaxID=354242 RepID=DER_CAMJJ|nr:MULTISPECIES: ribosome biogenesis GTPase Der [Campylobacter]A1VYA6.1 RecName: Full=GTPase Der; AltName: Full=GTP-binding protein EngA [Campylobacter jejuni subsp. jejuni 81-176]ADT65761.1 GTPase family protein [Campylobacter jejuni subsp. jejuni ICDCCJ07001]EAK5450411.1 ribosome biogenesis GTPase Der [Campylobacter hyointestinalis]EDO6745231.1 ribosome biogenesis GTPase Der [Campylobacter coli]ETJ81876.1 GTP-binding protein Der [Campylobacter jejuni subsp. jejuni 81-176-DRH212]ETN90399.1 G
MQSIILIGKPNVGKSSLFNRMARQRIAITSDISGTTRDTNKTQIHIHSKKAMLIDSGGLDESDELFKNVKKNTLKVAKESDIILYLVDGKLAPDDEDRQFFYSLKKLGKPIALVVNKVDNKKDEERAWEFANFGVKEIFNLSVTHNVGLDELYEWLEKFLHEEFLIPDEEENLEDFLEHYEEGKEFQFKEVDQNHIRVGIVGRVNVGKSSLLNALVKQERSVVSSIAGTTIDPVNESVVHKDKVIEFVDTAGIRKRGKIQGLERFALNRTEKILSHSQIALLVLDAHEGFNELDERIAGLVAKHYLGVIIVLNKWDKSEMDFDKTVKELRLDRFKFLAYAPVISVSALSGKRVHVLLDKILQIFENFTQKIQTSKLNTLIENATRAHPLPHDYGKLVKIYYAVQYDLAPPKIALIMNRPKALHFSYKRYLQNQIRKEFNFEGVPLVIASRKKGSKENDES